MIKQPFMKIQEILFNLGKDTYVQIVLQTDTEHLLVAQNLLKSSCGHPIHSTKLPKPRRS